MSSKYQREIEDILEKSGGLGPGRRRKNTRSRPNFRRLVWLYLRQMVGGRILSVTPGRVMLIGFVLLLTMLLVMPFVAGATGYLAWAGLLLFIIGYGMVLARPPRIEKRWRGESIGDPSDSWIDRIRRRFGR